MKLRDPFEAQTQATLAASAPSYAEKPLRGRLSYPQTIRTEPGRLARYTRKQWKQAVTTFGGK